MTDRHDAVEPEPTEPEPTEPGDLVEEAEAVEPEARTERRSDVVIVTLVFVVLYGYDLLEAIANLTGLPALYDAAGVPDGVPWPVLVAGVVVPPVLFAAASAFARGRRLAARAGVLLLGLAVSAQLALLLEELARQAAVTAFGS